ncbi:MAG: hypothetical protein QM808_06935 [Steroidobacteraceae bacterium]
MNYRFTGLDARLREHDVGAYFPALTFNWLRLRLIACRLTLIHYRFAVEPSALLRAQIACDSNASRQHEETIMNRHPINQFRLFRFCALATLTCLATLPALSASAPRDEIAFANHGGIRDWAADGSKGMWVQSNSGKWFYAKFSFPCNSLAFTTRVKFRTGPLGELDRWGGVNTRYDRCNFIDFKASDKPMRKRSRSVSKQGLAETAPKQVPSHKKIDNG